MLEKMQAGVEEVDGRDVVDGEDEASERQMR